MTNGLSLPLLAARHIVPVCLHCSDVISSRDANALLKEAPQDDDAAAQGQPLHGLVCVEETPEAKAVPIQGEI